MRKPGDTCLNRENITSYSFIANYKLTADVFVYRDSTIFFLFLACFFVPCMLYFFTGEEARRVYGNSALPGTRR
jgi:hypothetical protein